MSKGIYFKDIPLNNGDDLCGKYQSTSHVNGTNYARIWYNGDEIDARKTYTRAYLEKQILITKKADKKRLKNLTKGYRKIALKREMINTEDLVFQEKYCYCH